MAHRQDFLNEKKMCRSKIFLIKKMRHGQNLWKKMGKILLTES